MDPLREVARRDPQGVAVVDADSPGAEWSWRELDAGADAAAIRLTEAGVGPGDRVATLLSASLEFLVLLHALPRIGAVLQPLPLAWTGPEREAVLSGGIRPALLVAPAFRVPELRRAHPQVGTVAVEEFVLRDSEDGLVHRLALPPADEDTPVAVLLTSGTSGQPRPVPLTQGNLLASARGAEARLRLDPADRWLASLSPAHVGGFALLHRAAVVGCSVVVCSDPTPDVILDLADRGEITHLSLVPVQLRRLLELRGETSAPRALRCVLLGGAATPHPLLDEALRRRWPIALTYGMTEATSQVATAPPEEVRRRPGSVGQPLPGVELHIQSPSPDGVGEIWVRGPTVALLPRRVPGRVPSSSASPHVDAEGWLHTGDLGRRDDEGRLWITGRSSHRIVTGGVTLEPEEVAAALAGHPGILEVAVTGAPDPEWGERVVAVVVPRDPASPPTLEDLLVYARERLAPAKRPRELRIREALPRNANGKVDRSQL